MEIAIIVLLSIVLVALIFLIVLLLNRKPNDSEIKEISVKQTTEIISSISNLKEAFPLQTRNAIIEEMAKINTTVGDLNVKNQQILGSFQEKIEKKLDDKIDSLNKKVDANLSEIRDKVDRTINDGFKETGETMLKLQKALNEMNSAQENIKALSGQVVSLQSVLNNNQGRGRYGEIQLEMLLASMFGESNKGILYDVQYKLNDQLKPDAVVFMDGEANGNAILCIDSKFAIHGYDSLFDNSSSLSEEEKAIQKKGFKSALKAQIDQVSKYVIDGKTLNVAIMFIPNDGIFAFVENEYPELTEYARSKSVTMTCPTIIRPLIAALRVIQNDSQKNKNLLKINEALISLSKDFKRFGDRWSAIDKTIESLHNKTTDFNTTVKKLDSKFNKISGGVIERVDGNVNESEAEVEDLIDDN